MTLAEAIKRKQIIQSAWTGARKNWDWRKNGPSLRVPIPFTLRAFDGILTTFEELSDQPPRDHYLIFTVRFEVMCSQQSYVIRCEGVICEQGFCDE